MRKIEHITDLIGFFFENSFFLGGGTCYKKKSNSRIFSHPPAPIKMEYPLYSYKSKKKQSCKANMNKFRTGNEMEQLVFLLFYFVELKYFKSIAYTG